MRYRAQKQSPVQKHRQSGNAGKNGNGARRKAIVEGYCVHIFSIARNFALRLAGFNLISVADAVSGFLYKIFASPFLERCTKYCLTILSSTEWNVMTTTRPPHASALHAAERPFLSAPSSSLTAMRIA